MYGIESPPFYFPLCPVQKQWTKIKIMVNGSIIIAKLEQPVQPCSPIFLLCIFIIVMAIMILLSWWSLLETISSKLSNSNDIIMYYIDQKVPNCEVYVGKWRRIHEVAGSTWQGEHYFLTYDLWVFIWTSYFLVLICCPCKIFCAISHWKKLCWLKTVV